MNIINSAIWLPPKTRTIGTADHQNTSLCGIFQLGTAISSIEMLKY